MNFYYQYHRNFAITCPHNKSITLSFAKVIFSVKRIKWTTNCMSSLNTINEILPFNHIGCCIQLLANLSNYASIKLHFKNWYFIHQLIIIVILISSTFFYICNIFSNKSREKITLKFAKLMNFVQKMSDNAPNRMYVFQKCLGGDTPGTPFGAGT